MASIRQQPPRLESGQVVGIGKRMTLAKQLEHLRNLPEAERLRIFQETGDLSKQFEGFRHHAPRTQSYQDRHLAFYRGFIAFPYGKTADEFEADELEELTFPADDMARMYENFRRFLIWYYSYAPSRSKLTGDTISYRQLSKVRDSLAFWVKHKRRQRRLPVLAPAELFYLMNEAMRAALSHYSANETLATIPDRPEKPYLGLSELRQLFDYEMTHNRSIELSEQHQAAWCIARLTACRPGSICSSGKYARNIPLRWRDLEFQMEGGPGKVNIIIHFWRMDIKAPQSQLLKEGGGRPAHVHIRSPAEGNLIFSAAHRLLVIAIRRGVLQEITSISELMEYKKRNILIKPERKNDFLFYRGVAKGTGIDFTKPLTANALSQYLKSRCHMIGYIVPAIGMLAIRRRAASDLVTRIGTETTRRILGHDPSTYTLERYYLFVGPMLDQGGLLLDQLVGDHGFSDHYRAQWAPLATGALSDDAIRRTRGIALHNMIDRLALLDDNPPVDALETAEGRKNYRAHLRLYAHRALLEQEAKEAEANITQAEFEGRQRELQASSFASKVLARALEIQASETTRTAPIATNDLFVPEEVDLEEEDEPERDLEDGPDSKEIIEICMDDEIDDIPGQEAQISYENQAMAFMETLMDNSMNTDAVWSERDTTCPECQEDETVDVATKMRRWETGYRLNAHLNSNYHTPIEKFRRVAEKRASEHPEGLYVCPYCEESKEQRAEFGLEVCEYAREKGLERHIKKATEERDGEKHDELKKQAGWYDEGFFKQVLESSKKKREVQGEKNIGKLGIPIVHSRPGLGRPHPDLPFLKMGAGPSRVPDRLAGKVNMGPLPPNPPPGYVPKPPAGITLGSLPAIGSQVIPEGFHPHVYMIHPPRHRLPTEPVSSKAAEPVSLKMAPPPRPSWPKDLMPGARGAELAENTKEPLRKKVHTVISISSGEESDSDDNDEADEVEDDR